MAQQQIDWSKLPDQSAEIDLSGLPDQEESIPKVNTPARSTWSLLTDPIEKRTTQGGFFDAIKALPDIGRNLWEHPKETLGGFGQGVMEGIKSFSPLDIVDAATIPFGGPKLKIAQKVLSGLVAGKGVEHIAEGDTLTGTAEVLGGGLGLKGFGKGAKPIAKVADDVPVKVEAEIPKVETPIVKEAIQPDLPLQEVPVKTPIDKLIEATEKSKPLNKLQAQIYSIEKSRRLGQMKNIEGGGQKGAQERMSQLAGEHTKVSIEPLKLDQTDVDELYDIINKHPASIGFSEAQSISGLTRLLNGQVPRNSEIEQLRKVFGDEFALTLRKNLPIIDKTKGFIQEAVNLPRAIMASSDFSAPLRQGLGLFHRKEYWTSFDDMFKSFGSDKAFRAVQESIQSQPNFKLAQDSNLSLTDLYGLSNREEQFMSTWAERIPIMGRGIRASNRAYVGFLNKLRADTFNSLVNNLEKAGLKPHENLILTKELAAYINTATGRGSLGKLEAHANTLNSVLFSPRLQASRLQLLGKPFMPSTYMKMNPAIRKEYLKTLFSMAGVGTAVVELGKLAGGKVINDPTSSDFRKLKIGNTRLDPYAGMQQYLVAASRLMTNEQTSSNTGRTYELGGKFGSPTRLDVAGRFVESKLNPVLSFATTMLRGKDFTGQPVHVQTEIANRFIPIIVQDVLELAQEDPNMIPLAIPASFGMGMQTYSGKEPKGIGALLRP